MIEIQTVEATDAFGYRYLSFNFKTGLHRIVGENGSSKSSVFATLIHCLANKNPKGGKVDDVFNKITGKPYEIEVRALKDGDSFKFVNSKKAGTVEIWRNGHNISLNRIPDNLKLIQEILGADFTLLCDLLYQSKDSTLDILETGTDRGRKTFLNRVLKMSEIDEQAARMKEKEKELSGKNGRIAFLVKQLETLELSLGELAPEDEELEIIGTASEISVLTDEINALSDERRRVEGELKSTQLQIATAEGEQATHQRIADLEAEMPQTTIHPDKGQAQLENVQAEIHALKLNASALRNELARAVKAQEQLDLLAEYRANLAQIPKPDKDRPECLDQMNKIQRAHAATKAKLEDVRKQLTQYRQAAADKVCPTCGSAENWERIQALVTQLETDEVQHQLFIEKCEAGAEKYAQRLQLYERRDRIEAEIAKLAMIAPVELDVPLAEQRLRSYEKKIGQLEATGAALKQELAEHRRGLELRAQIEKLRAGLKGAELSEGLYLTEDMLADSLDDADHALDQKRQRLASLQQRLDLAKQHNATVRARREVNRQIAERNTQIQLQISQTRLELAAAERKLDCIKEWNGILGNKGFRVARIKKFLTSLNATMAKYSQMICDGRISAYFYINPDGEVEFTISDAAKEMDYPLWSGGEKARVRLMTLFAVLELLEVMGSVSFNALCLDEVFDALDSDGKEGLFKVLEYLKQKGKAIYVIAHSELALDLSYDSVIRAVKHQDGTTEIVQ